MKDAVKDTHPSFAVARFNRASTGSDGVSLFDSEIRHSRLVTFDVYHAERERDLNHDWIRSVGVPIVEIEMSEAQFGALVSSFGDGAGVPVMLKYVATGNVVEVEPPPYAPRAAESLREIGEATGKVFDTVADAVADLRKSFDKGVGKREMETKLKHLEWMLENAKPNTKFVAESFTKHVETVVTKARADIEATAQFAVARGLTMGDDVKKLLP